MTTTQTTPDTYRETLRTIFHQANDLHAYLGTQLDATDTSTHRWHYLYAMTRLTSTICDLAYDEGDLGGQYANGARTREATDA